MHCSINNRRNTLFWVEGLHEWRGNVTESGCTLDDSIKAAWGSHIGDFGELEGTGPIFVIEVGVHPGGSVEVANGASHFVAGGEELVDDMRSDEAIGACYNDGRAFGNGEVGCDVRRIDLVGTHLLARGRKQGRRGGNADTEAGREMDGDVLLTLERRLDRELLRCPEKWRVRRVLEKRGDAGLFDERQCINFTEVHLSLSGCSK